MGVLFPSPMVKTRPQEVRCARAERPSTPDTITGEATKGEWTLSGQEKTRVSHDVNLTWHNASLLSGVIEGLTKSEIEAQLAFGEEKRVEPTTSP